MPAIRRLSIASLIAASLAACGQQPTEKAITSAGAAQVSDPVTSTATEAMCADAADRAHAIGRIARDPAVNGDPDAVYDVAATIAEKGCPKPKG